ncbi:MAG: hypothetical protein PSU93_09275 [Methylobacter sp.]|uniref:Uncharacterized protein n=1 Tax=Candidatus Methylobacter titanis TaxID=3053457 RepID=A0AA43TKK0_9GAMM|nr:hypothetical protein [Candidatus Methylobacter titanis]
MGRSSSVNSSIKIAKSKSFPVGGVFTAPTRLVGNRVLVTGCAAGGSSGNGVAGGNVSSAAYGAGLFYCTNAVGAPSQANMLDPYTRAKHATSTTVLAASTGGGFMAASEDGFVITITNGAPSSPFAVSRNYGDTWATYYQTTTTLGANGVAISPINTDLALFSNSGRYIEYTLDRGVTWVGSFSFNFSTNMAVMTGCKFLKDKFALFGGITTGTAGVVTSIETPSSTYANWTQTTVFASTQVNDIDYDPITGIFVAVGNTGSIATATSLTGTWTVRASGTTDHLTGVKFANGVWVTVGATGRVCKSTDSGATWAATTVGVTTFSGTRSIAYASLMGANGTWFIKSAIATTIYSSKDNAVTWVASTAGTNNYVIASPVSAITSSTSSVSITKDGINWYPYQTSLKDGGDFVVVDKTGEKLRLAGGQGTTTYFGGNGGSTEGLGSIAPTGSNQPGLGEGGTGGAGGTVRIPPTGAGGLVVTASNPCFGGGAAKQLVDITATPGRKFPGGSGTTNTTSGYVGGGSSIFGRGGSGLEDVSVGATAQKGQGAGAGAGSNNAAFGSAGAAESCYRYEVAVSPGGSLYISVGLKNDDNSITPNFQGNSGTCLIEWEEYV